MDPSGAADKLQRELIAETVFLIPASVAVILGVRPFRLEKIVPYNKLEEI